jgi:hypothetical protein
MSDENELRVPTVTLPVEIRYFDERPMRGNIFLPAGAQHHGGAMRPDEWMNQGTLFFPFQREEGGRPFVLNKRYVVVLTVLLTGEDSERDDEGGSIRKVKVQCGTLELNGTVYLEMPENQRRVLDFVNRPEPFLNLHDGVQRHIIQKNRITSITELVEE